MWDSNTIRTCSSWTSNSFSSTGITWVWNKAGDRRQLVWLSPVCSGGREVEMGKGCFANQRQLPKSYSVRDCHSWDPRCHPTASSDSVSCRGCQRRWEGGEAAVPLSIALQQRLHIRHVRQSRAALLGSQTPSYLGKTQRGSKQQGQRQLGTQQDIPNAPP